MPEQLSHNASPFKQQSRNIVIICDGVSSPANVGALFRIADAFGVSKLIFSEDTLDLTSSRLRRTARNCEDKVPHEAIQDFASCLSAYKKNGFLLVGLEITSSSVPIQSVRFENNQKIAIILGSEQHGISEDLLSLLDYTAHIEMFGMNSSMNVTQAASIALYEWTKK